MEEQLEGVQHVCYGCKQCKPCPDDIDFERYVVPLCGKYCKMKVALENDLDDEIDECLNALMIERRTWTTDLIKEILKFMDDDHIMKMMQPDIGELLNKLSTKLSQEIKTSEPQESSHGTAGLDSADTRTD